MPITRVAQAETRRWKVEGETDGIADPAQSLTDLGVEDGGAAAHGTGSINAVQA